MVTEASQALADVVGWEALATVRIALRWAAEIDHGCRRLEFATLYRRLGGEAEFNNRVTEEPA